MFSYFVRPKHLLALKPATYYYFYEYVTNDMAAQFT